ncbi:TPA: hypothetical protein QBZ48_001432 [Pasteurella multocida]|nr:hypothetical protein [Pasteurella multocida]
MSIKRNLVITPKSNQAVPSNNQPSTNGQPRGNQKVIRRVVWVSRIALCWN